MTHLKKKVLIFIGFLPLIVFLFSCGKEPELEEYPFLTFEDRSIPSVYNCLDFDVVDEEIIFVCNNITIEQKIGFYHSPDGGKEWNKIGTIPYDFEFYDLDFKSISFVDEMNGIVVFNDFAYRTFDGGNTWNPITVTFPQNQEEQKLVFAGKNQNNQFILADFKAFSDSPDGIYVLNPTENEATMLYQFPNPNELHFSHGRINNNHLYLFTQQSSFGIKHILHLDLTNEKLDSLTPEDYNINTISDVVHGNDRYLLLYGKYSVRFYGDYEHFKYVGYATSFKSLAYLEQDDLFIVGGETAMHWHKNGAWETIRNEVGKGKIDGIDIKKMKVFSKDFLYLMGSHHFSKARIHEVE